MKTALFSIIFSVAVLSAQTKPTIPEAITPAKTASLSDAQKNEILKAQIAVAELNAKRAQLESQYMSLSAQLEKAAAALRDVIAKSTPPGYTLQQPDLLLIPEKEKAK